MAKFKPLGINIPRFQFGTQKSGIQLQYSGPSYQEIREKMRKEDPHAYNELQARVAGGKSPSSEIVKYIDADGNFRSVPNVGAGYVSGADPVGEYVVEGAVVNKPLQLGIKGIGLVGKKAINQISKQLANSKKLGIVSKPIQNNNFQSQLDWSPKSWFEEAGKWRNYTQDDVKALASHVPEYHRIEEIAKANRTWLKMPDGSTWTGDPRSWVQLMSKNGSKLHKERLFHSSWRPGDKEKFPTYQDVVWSQDNPEMAIKWARLDRNNPYGQVFEITYPENVKTFSIDVRGKKWDDLPNVFNYKIGNRTPSKVTTNFLGLSSEKAKNKVTKIDNIVEGFGDLTNDVVIHPKTVRKSLLGNNGNFDLSNINIYRGLPPIVGFNVLNNE